MTMVYEWRGAFTNEEVNALHAEAFSTRVFGESEWNWVELVHGHSLGWAIAREGAELVGFVNVLWDGLVHAWLQDTMVAAKARGRGAGTQLVACARDGAKAAGCEYLHVDRACSGNHGWHGHPRVTPPAPALAIAHPVAPGDP